MSALRFKIKPVYMYSLVVFFYVVSTIAFESTSETAYISTIAIYLVFIAGMVYVFFHRKIIINIYIISSILLLLNVFIMSATPDASESMGFRITYLLLTCTILCIINYWLCATKEGVVHSVLLANIIGSFILVCRVISAYGGILSIFSIASADGENRIGNLIANENALGLYLAGAILSCMLFLMIRKRTIFQRCILIFCIIVFFGMLMLTGSRKSFVFGVVGIVLFLLLYFHRSNLVKKINVYLLILLAIIGVFYLLRTAPIFSTLYERFELLINGFFGDTTYATDVTRDYMITTGLDRFWDSPVFGNGTGISYTLFGTYSHNNFVELLMSYGVVGFLFYYIPQIYLIIKLLRPALNRDVYAIFFEVYVILQLVLGVGWVNYYERHTQLIIAAAWGYLTYKNKV